MRTSYLFAICFLFLQAACAQPAKPHWDAYLVSETLDTAHLPRLTEKQKEIQKKWKKEEEESKKRYDSLEKAMKNQPPEELDSIGIEAKKIRDKNSRETAEKARIFDSLHPEFAIKQNQTMNDNKTSITLTKDSPDNGENSGIINFISICEGYLINDTLLVGAGVGFMAGEGVEIKIYKNVFTASFGSNADGDSLYKKNLSDAFILIT